MEIFEQRSMQHEIARSMLRHQRVHMAVGLTWLMEAMRVRVRAQSLAAMRSRVYMALTWRTTSSRISRSTSCSLGSSSTPSGAQGIAQKEKKRKIRKEKKTLDYAFRRQFNEKPSIVPGCPGKGSLTTCMVVGTLSAERGYHAGSCSGLYVPDLWGRHVLID